MLDVESFSEATEEPEADGLQPILAAPASTTPIALELMGALEFQGGVVAAEELRVIALKEQRPVVVCTEKLRFSDFFGFRELIDRIAGLRQLGFDVMMSVSDPRLRAIVDDAGLGAACVSGLALLRCEPRRMYVGNRYSLGENVRHLREQ